jgi:CBS domain containing-hemolysin-like protein
LERRRRQTWLDWLVERAGELMMAAAILRLLANIGLILVTVALFQDRIDNVVAHYGAVLAVSGGVILVFGLAIPNAWAKYAGEELIVTTYYLLALCRIVLKPLTSGLHLADEIVRRLAGAPRRDDTDEAEQIEQEILDVVSEGEKHGAVDETEKEMIESVIELRDIHVAQIMTPRTEVIGLEVQASVADARQLIIKEGHSRIPLYDENIDKIVGVLYAKDLLRIDGDDDMGLRDLMRKVPFVPESKSLRDLLKEFQETKIHLAIVIDEYGGTAGLVTFEDILEELVGEIVDEYEPPEPEPLTRIDDSTVEVDAKLRIDELNDELDVQLPEGKDYDTVGGFVLSDLGRIPSVGEEVMHNNVQIRIIDADDRKISRLRVSVDRSQPVERGDDED